MILDDCNWLLIRLWEFLIDDFAVAPHFHINQVLSLMVNSLIWLYFKKQTTIMAQRHFSKPEATDWLVNEWILKLTKIFLLFQMKVTSSPFPSLVTDSDKNAMDKTVMLIDKWNLVTVTLSYWIKWQDCIVRLYKLVPTIGQQIPSDCIWAIDEW